MTLARFSLYLIMKGEKRRLHKMERKQKAAILSFILACIIANLDEDGEEVEPVQATAGAVGGEDDEG